MNYKWYRHPVISYQSSKVKFSFLCFFTFFFQNYVLFKQKMWINLQILLTFSLFQILSQQFLISFPSTSQSNNNADAKTTGCRFAHQYTQAQILSNPQPFLQDYISWETKFIKEVGTQNSTGMTYDGYRLDVNNGTLLNGGLHYWTASSKQSIHVGLLAYSLYHKSSIIYTENEVFELIGKKVNTLENFHKKYPGFAGFFPWVYLNGSEPTPTYDFASRTPALDNGEFFWSAVALSHAWQKNYPDFLADLRQRWDNTTWKPMVRNAKKVFFNESTKKIRAVANIKNISLPVDENSYSNDDYYYLDDPYEGELFNWIVTLFPSSQTNFTKEEVQFIWEDKRNKLQTANYYIPQLQKNITVEKGWWFSAHEQWKHLFMPYQDVSYYAEIMKNKEKARTWHSALKLLPGMFASVTGPAQTNTQNMDYYSDCGIESISFNKVNHVQMVTPYSSFPLFLVNRTMGAVWLHNMLYSPAAQNIYGATQATRIDGHAISPVMTWDSKITTVLAILGGNKDIIREYLEKNKMLSNFYNRIDSEYRRQIPKIEGTEIDYSLPKTKVNKGRADFPNCKL